MGRKQKPNLAAIMEEGATLIDKGLKPHHAARQLAREYGLNDPDEMFILCGLEEMTEGAEVFVGLQRVER
jgi:hypothetical protein